MNWFKDIIRAIRKRKFIFLLLFLQLTISMANAYIATFRWQANRYTNIKATNFKEMRNTYAVWINLSENIPPLKKLEFSIVDELKGKSKYKIAGAKTLQEEKKDANYIMINKEFIDIFKFDVIRGTSHFEEDKNQALVGYELMGKYKLGDKIRCNELKKDVEIIGFLKENHVSFEEFTSTSLNNSIIIFSKDIGENINNCFVYSKEGYTKVKKDSAEILAPYGSIQVTDLEEQNIDDKIVEYREAKNSTFYSIGMFIFSLSVFISLLILIINKNKRSIGIKLACGAKRISIYGYMLGQLLFVYVSASLLVFVIVFLLSASHGSSRKIFEFFSSEYLIGMNLGILSVVILITVPILVKIMRLEPSELVKSE